MDHLSHSATAVSKDCKRKYYYRYQMALQRRREPSAALSYGKLWHRALAEWYRTGSASAANAVIEQYAKKGEADRARAMLAGYIARWADDMPMMSLADYRVTNPVRNPSTGRTSQRFYQLLYLDLLALHNDGAVWLWEHKTASRVDGSYLGKLWSDAQITGYFAALIDQGIDVAGVVYDVALKPRIKQKKSETSEEFGERLQDWHLTNPDAYHREAVYVSPQQVQDWREDTWQLTQEILSCRRTGCWYRNTGRCFDYYSECEFLPLCQNGTSEALINAEYEPRQSPADKRNNQPEQPW